MTIKKSEWAYAIGGWVAAFLIGFFVYDILGFSSQEEEIVFRPPPQYLAYPCEGGTNIDSVGVVESLVHVRWKMWFDSGEVCEGQDRKMWQVSKPRPTFQDSVDMYGWKSTPSPDYTVGWTWVNARNINNPDIPYDRHCGAEGDLYVESAKGDTLLVRLNRGDTDNYWNQGITCKSGTLFITSRSLLELKKKIRIEEDEKYERELRLTKELMRL
tara:strand:- start:1584 stop:2225 length:642 start_codon:yes stop_codon:yes gene_type:complete